MTLFWKEFLSGWKRYFSNNGIAKMITIGLFFLVGGLVASGLYYFFVRSFAYVGSDHYFGQALILYVSELLFLIVLGLSLWSAAISSLYSYFRTLRQAWIIASPRYIDVAWNALLKTFLGASWPMLLVALPALVAAHRVFQAPIILLFAVFAQVLILLFGASLGVSLLIFLIAKILDSEGKLRFPWLAAITTVILLLTSLIGAVHIRSAEITQLLRATDTGSTVVDTADVARLFAVFPSHFVANSFFFAIRKSAAEPLEFLALGFVVCALLTYLFRLVLRWYLKFWQILQEHASSPRAIERRRISGQPERFIGGPTQVLLRKESLLFLRDGRGLLWLLFLLLIWLVQIATNRYLAVTLSKNAVSVESVLQILQAFQLVVSVYFISAVTLRFAFPSFSLEARTSWIIGSAPVPMRAVYWGKFIFYVVGLSSLSSVLTVINGLILGFPTSAFLVFLGATTLATATAIALGFSLGALFPNFEVDNPEMLATSIPGLAYTATTLLYGSAAAFLFFRFLQTGYVLPLVILGVVSFVIAIPIVLRASVRVEELEYVPSINS